MDQTLRQMRPRSVFSMLLLLLLATVSRGLGSSVCPQSCSCSSQTEINCVQKFLKAVPFENVPTDFPEMNLGFNHITVIEDEAFVKLSILQVLQLNNNAISILEPRAFAGLDRLLKLNLRNNRLTRVSTIQNLCSLTELQLSENFIQNIEAEDLHGLGSRRLDIRIDHNFLSRLSKISVLVTDIHAISSGLAHFDLHQMKQASRLININLQSNRIRYIPDLGGLTSLEGLILAGNPIHALSEATPPMSLTSVDMTDASLSYLPETWTVSRIRYLFLDRNQLKTVHDLFRGSNSSINKISLSGNPIQGLQNIAPSPSLKTIFMNEARLSKEFILDIRIMPNVKSLFLSDNEISRFRIETFQARADHLGVHSSDPTTVEASLAVLNLDKNAITDVAFVRDLPKLQTLYLRHNKIRQIEWLPTDTHDHLRYIDLSNNELSVLTNFTGMSFLQILHVSYNKINIVNKEAFTASPNMKYLNLRGNKLTKFPDLNLLTKLHTLDLSMNSLSGSYEDDLSKLTSLTTLNISSNGITNISIPAYVNKVYLQDNLITSTDGTGNPLYLNVGNNRISDIGGWNLAMHEKRMVDLTVDNNELINVPPTFGLNRLQCLHNHIRILPVNICGNASVCNIPCNLRALLLGWNKISYISPSVFKGCSKLLLLSLEGNPILSFPAHQLQHRTILFLSNTMLLNLAGQTNSTLRSLFLDNVELFRHKTEANISFIVPTIEQSLSLQGNEIFTIPTLEAQFLEQLDLSNNSITSLSHESFKGIPYVRVIDLSRNLIRSISGSSFAANFFIKKLNLEHNRIQDISHSAFLHQGQFILQLGHNKLERILPSSLPVLSKTVSFDPNPWHCDCQLLPLKDWLLQSGLYQLDCWNPPRFRNRSLQTLMESEIRAYSSEDYELSGDDIDIDEGKCLFLDFSTDMPTVTGTIASSHHNVRADVDKVDSKFLPMLFMVVIALLLFGILRF